MNPSPDSSIQVPNAEVDKITADPAFPFLISFPRTGSHWLRMVMELYFQVPALVRIFYYKDAQEFTCCHRHDEDLKLSRQNVIYLYRHPVDTIYSQMNYYKEDSRDTARVNYWADLYARHLKKWLLDETFTVKKTVLSYEGMKKDFDSQFERVCRHLSRPFDPAALHAILPKITKTEVKEKTLHDPQVINTTNDYPDQRSTFKAQYTAAIMDILNNTSPHLPPLFH